jgi:hypothetical protein
MTDKRPSKIIMNWTSVERKEEKRDQGDADMKEQRQQCGLSFWKLDNERNETTDV